MFKKIKDLDTNENIEAAENLFLFFFAPWSPQSVDLDKDISEIEDTPFDGIEFCKVNVDENPDLTEHYKVTKLPSLMFLKKGKEENRIEGEITSQFFLDFIQRNKLI